MSMERHTRDRKWPPRRFQGGGRTDAVSGEEVNQLPEPGNSAAFSLIPVQKDGRCLFRAVVDDDDGDGDGAMGSGATGYDDDDNDDGDGRQRR